jgi:carboxylesterase type B
VSINYRLGVFGFLALPSLGSGAGDYGAAGSAGGAALGRWGAFAWTGAPHWPPYSSGRVLSLRPGGQTTTLSDEEFAAEHRCAFWASSNP